MIFKPLNNNKNKKTPILIFGFKKKKFNKFILPGKETFEQGWGLNGG